MLSRIILAAVLESDDKISSADEKTVHEASEKIPSMAGPVGYRVPQGCADVGERGALREVVQGPGPARHRHGFASSVTVFRRVRALHHRAKTGSASAPDCCTQIWCMANAASNFPENCK